MQSDLARFQLFQLNENFIRLHGLCANFSPEIIKHDRMNADMTVAKQKYDEIVRESLLHVKQTRQRDPSPPSNHPSHPQPPLPPPSSSPPSTLPYSPPRQLYSDAVKIGEKVIPHLMTLNLDQNNNNNNNNNTNKTER